MAALRKEPGDVRATTERERQARKAAASSEHQELKQKYDELQQTLEAKDRMIEALNSTASSLQQSLVNLRQQLATTSEELAQLRGSSGTWSKLRRSRWFSWCFLGLL
jgi:chromosome segregation ATPase